MARWNAHGAVKIHILSLTTLLQNYRFRDISEYHIETQNLRAISVPSRLRVKIY